MLTLPQFLPSHAIRPALLVLSLTAVLAQPVLGAASLPLDLGESVATCFSGFNNPSNPASGINASGFVVAMVDTRDPLGNGAQLGLNWAAQMHHNEMSNATSNPADVWSAANLGQVFGLALDDAARPNIYVAAASIYTLSLTGNAISTNMFGPLGPGGIYRLDGTTGAICNYAQLPNTGPGLGNIAYDRANKQLFASNFDNGLIYRIPVVAVACDTLVAPTNTFDHGQSGRPAASLPPLLDDGSAFVPPNINTQSGFTARGRRIWGLQVFKNRLYYSVWNVDSGHPGAGQNEIWSVGLQSGTGNFDLGSVRREIFLPFFSGTYSNPVSDIAFSGAGKMLVAERVRQADYGVLGSDAHQARVLEYSGAFPNWGTAKRIYVGNYATGTHANSAGGIDYGYGYRDVNGDGLKDRVCDETILSTGDALRFGSTFNPDNLQPSVIYGLQLAPAAGNIPNISPPASSAPNSVGKSSIFIGLNPPAYGNVKTEIGDVEVSREDCLAQPPPRCMTTTTLGVLCETGPSGQPTGNFLWTFQVTNQTPVNIYHLFVASLPPGVTVNQPHVVFTPPIPPGGVRTITLKVVGASPGQVLTFGFTIHDQVLDECCAQQVEVTMPRCDCGQVIHDQPSSCFPLFPPPFVYSLTLQNLSGITVSYIVAAPVSPIDLVTPVSPSQLTLNKYVVPVPALASGSSTSLTFQISGPGAQQGSKVCLRLSLQDKDFRECCSVVRCVTLPVCFDPIDWDFIGDVTILFREAGLEISGIGTSGGDGISLGLGAAAAAAFGWLDLDPAGTVPDGAFLQMEAFGSAGETPDLSLGTLRVTDTGTQYEIAAPPPSALPGVRMVQVLDGEQVVAELPGGGDRVARVSDWPTGTAVERAADGSYTLAFTAPPGSLWDLDGGPAVAGDRLAVTNFPATSTVRSFSRLDLTAARISSITLTRGEVTPAAETGCSPGPEQLCLAGGRFRVRVSWRIPEGPAGGGQAVDLTGNTGYFWFFSAGNVELVVKVLDGREVNDHWWVFYASLSDVEYTLTVTDTTTGLARTYFNPAGRLASAGDTQAFEESRAAGGAAAHAAAAPASLPSVKAGCAAGPTMLCLAAERFRVEVTWRDSHGANGAGMAVPLTGDTGYFWFFDDANVELVLKVLDGRALNGHWWVFYGALSDVEYTITVTDTETGQTKTYTNPAGRLSSRGDTEAF